MKADPTSDAEIARAVASDPDTFLLDGEWFKGAKVVLPKPKEAAMISSPPPFPAALSPQMEALVLKMAAEDGPPVDTTLLPPPEGRAITDRLARRWNADLPVMASARDVVLPADAALGSARISVRVLTPPDARPGAVLFAHGGGFVFCSAATHERFARQPKGPRLPLR